VVGFNYIQINKSIWSHILYMSFEFRVTIVKEGCVTIGRVHMWQIVANSLIIDQFDKFCGFGWNPICKRICSSELDVHTWS
jgi:hypothetical protein